MKRRITLFDTILCEIFLPVFSTRIKTMYEQILNLYIQREITVRIFIFYINIYLLLLRGVKINSQKVFHEHIYIYIYQHLVRSNSSYLYVRNLYTCYSFENKIKKDGDTHIIIRLWSCYVDRKSTPRSPVFSTSTGQLWDESWLFALMLVRIAFDRTGVIGLQNPSDERNFRGSRLECRGDDPLR